MLVETKARVGVFAIALGAYLPQFPSLVPEFEGQYRDFKKQIPASSRRKRSPARWPPSRWILRPSERSTPT